MDSIACDLLVERAIAMLSLVVELGMCVLLVVHFRVGTNNRITFKEFEIQRQVAKDMK